MSALGFIVATNAADNWVGLGLSVALLVFLIVVLVFPEKF